MLTAFLLIIVVFFSGFYLLKWIQKPSYRSFSSEWDPHQQLSQSTLDQNPLKEAYLKHSKEPNPNPTTLAQLLMKRAMYAIQIGSEMQDQKSSMENLFKQGLIGEELWRPFEKNMKLLESEMIEVVNEANQIKPNWGDQIFPQAKQLLLMEMKRQQELQEKKREEEEKELKIKETKEREDLAEKMAQELLQEEANRIQKQKKKSK